LTRLGLEFTNRKTAAALTTGMTISRDIHPGQPARRQIFQHPGSGAMTAQNSNKSRPIWKA
jgi:hypothetical protein